jgi:hypothetical protein
MGDYRRGLDRWINLLTTYTNGSELQAITAPHYPPQFTNHHGIGFFQPAVSSAALLWQRLLTVEILQLRALKSSFHRISYRTDSVAPVLFLITPRHRPLKKTVSNSTSVAAECLRRNGPGISRARCIATALHATIRWLNNESEKIWKEKDSSCVIHLSF